MNSSLKVKTTISAGALISTVLSLFNLWMPSQA